MNYLYVCNTHSDYVSKVNLNLFEEEKKIPLLYNNIETKVGPHGMVLYNDKLIIANNYSNSISVIDISKDEEINRFYVGVHCNDVVVFDDKAYVICGDLNNVVVISMIENKVVEEIPCGNLPHSICLNKEKKLLLISNIQDDSITLIDCTNNENVKNIRVGAYPTKAVFTVDGKYALICESNIGSDFRGNICVMSLKNYKILDRISVGNSPVDMYCNERYCFVSNFGDGSLSIVDINHYKELKNITVGGMPRGIVKFGNCLYVGDNYNNLLMKVNIKSEEKKYIPIGGEPTGMTLS